MFYYFFIILPISANFEAICRRNGSKNGNVF